MPPAIRKFALTVHLTSSVGWIGAVLAYLALGLAAVTSSDVQTVRAAWTAMDLTGWWVIVPLAIAALLTGLVMSLGTHWGLFRHYWVLMSLGLTVLCTVVLVLHMPTVSTMASTAQKSEGAELRALGGDLFHPGVGLLLLLAVTVLNVYKPAGLTPYGWRKQRDERRMRGRTAPATSTIRPAHADAQTARQTSTLRALGNMAGSFIFHFAEMWFAMFLGMVVFTLLRFGLLAQGVTALLDATSLEFQVGMGVFMVGPMTVWMRVRGCSWRECVEMSAAMMLSTAAALILRGLNLRDSLVWVASNQHMLMLVGMLTVMLYRRQHYTRGDSFAQWPSAAQTDPQRSVRLRSAHLQQRRLPCSVATQQARARQCGWPAPTTRRRPRRDA